jgi:ABC-type amino acid transport/signal transduction systems, periplasmic component/domain
MKKIIAAIMIFVLVLALAACGQTKDPSAEATWEDQLGNKGVIRIGNSPNYPPYDDVDENGNIIGYDADFVAFVSDYLDYEVELIPLEFNTIIASLDAGTIDLGVSCFSYKEDRIVEYSDSYLDTTQAVLVRADSGIETSEDLAGRTISAGRGNVGLDLCYEFQTTMENVEVVVGEETAVSVEALKSGAFDAYLAERAVCEAYANASDGKLIVLEEDFWPDSIFVVAKKGNAELIGKINEAIEAYRASEESQNIFDKWFK